VRRGTKGGDELVALQLAIARGEEIPVPGRARGQRPTRDQRQQAIEWLANRGWGKVKEYVELSGEATPSQRLELLRRLSDEDRNQLREILARALNGASAPGSDAPDDAPALASPPPLEEATSDLPPSDTTT
jgi:hypothetical protein